MGDLTYAAEVIDDGHEPLDEFFAHVAERVSDPGRLDAVRATGLLDSRAEAAFDRIAVLASRLLDAPFGFVTLVDDQRSFWKACVGVNATDPAERQNQVSESFCQYVVGLDEVLLVNDARLDERTKHNPSIESMGVLAWAGVPLRSPEGEVLGTVCVVDTKVRSWSAADAGVLAELSALAAEMVAARRDGVEALLDRQAFAEVAERARSRGWLELLAQLTRRLSAATSVDEVAAAIDEEGAAVIGADRLVLGMLEPESGMIALRGEQGDGPISRLDPGRSESTSFAEALRTGSTITVVNRAQRLREFPDGAALAEAAGAVATATTPLRAADGAELGLLIACWTREMIPEAVPVSRLEVLADVVAQSVGRARSADQQRALVSSLQEALLSPPPPVDGLELAVRYAPALDSLGFGGDWYDVVPLDADRTVLIVGDVVGHDAEAAACMSQVRTVIATLVHTGTSLAELFPRCDEVLAARVQSTMATVAVIVADTSNQTLTTALAGHPPPLLAAPDGTVTPLPAGVRPPLGVGSDLCEPLTTSYAPGSVVLAYTDGLSETRGGDVDTDLAALGTRFGAMADLPPELLADRLLATSASASDIPDDIALVVGRLL